MSIFPITLKYAILIAIESRPNLLKVTGYMRQIKLEKT